MDWIDITMTIRSGMVHWPGDEEIVVERIQDLESGGPYNLSRISMGLHAGTHIDAPLHFLPRGAGIDEMPLDAVVGPARVIGIRDMEAVTRSELEPQDIREGERILLKTANSYRTGSAEFLEDYVYVSPEAAHYLAEKGIRAVGVDYLSVGPNTDEAAEVHEIFLQRDVWIIEGLDLSRVEPGGYELLCLPLKVAGGDGAPARAILRPLRR
jgi:arylformamidase